MDSTKTDNANLAAKVALRRHFLERYHVDRPPLVFDCCQGSGMIWRRIRRRFPCEYWGVDVKPKKGRLLIDSVRVLDQPGWTFDVIDVDTYGAPWKHWAAILRHMTKSATVFLTIGDIHISNIDNYAVESLGMTFKRLKPPSSLASKMRHLAISHCLGRAADHDVNIIEAMEVESGSSYGQTRYIGLRLEREKP